LHKIVPRNKPQECNTWTNQGYVEGALHLQLYHPTLAGYY